MTRARPAEQITSRLADIAIEQLLQRPAHRREHEELRHDPVDDTDGDVRPSRTRSPNSSTGLPLATRLDATTGPPMKPTHNPADPAAKITAVPLAAPSAMAADTASTLARTPTRYDSAASPSPHRLAPLGRSGT